MRIALTGASGFLGRLVAKRMDVLDVGDSDLRHIESIRYVTDCYPDAIVHLAANVGGIGANQAAPADLFYDNIMMGVQLMHEAWRTGVKKFVTVATVCAYPKYCDVPFHEDDIWDGYPEETNAPYGLAKKMLIVQAQAYRKQHGFNAVVLIPTNLYGPGDNFDLDTSHVIPAMIRKFVEAKRAGDKSVTLWGDGSPTREFLYVADCAEAIQLATEGYDGAEPINIGTGVETRIRDLAHMVREMAGYTGDIIWDKSKPNGQPRRCLDVTRARKVLGFEAQTQLADGLARTVKWYECEH